MTLSEKKTKQMLIDLWHELSDKRSIMLNEINTNNHMHLLSEVKNKFYTMFVNEYVDIMDSLNDIISQMK